MSDPHIPVLYGNTFLLRAWDGGDARWYVESRDEQVFQWTNERRDLTISETEAAILRVRSDPTAIAAAIADRANGQLLGSIALAFRSEDRASAEVMYWLAPWGRGRGIATAAVELLCHWAAGQHGVRHVTLKALAGNQRSQLVSTRAGFHQIEPASGQQDGEYLWFEKVYGEAAGALVRSVESGSEE